MEQLIRKVINNYSSLVAKKETYERHLEARENADMRDALVMLKMQIGAIESWFALLNVEERVIFRQVLFGDHDAIAANRIAATRWIQGLAAVGQSPCQIKESAIQKVAAFAGAHQKLMSALFENV